MIFWATYGLLLVFSMRFEKQEKREDAEIKVALHAFIDKDRTLALQQLLSTLHIGWLLQLIN